LNTIFILLALLVAILSPLTAHVSIPSADHAKYFVTLDVCSASGSFLSANADAPSLLEGFCIPASYEFAEFFQPGSTPPVSSLFSVQIEQPPRI